MAFLKKGRKDMEQGREVTKRSRIKKFINDELYLELYKVTMLGAGYSNDDKVLVIYDLLDKYKLPWSQLGSGTNRVGILIDGYVFKFALDKDGMIDNRREFLYSKVLQPSAIKIYECISNGLVAVSEYVTGFEPSDFANEENRAKMRKILSDISDRFLIGDVGFSSKNFGNWGKRTDGSICMLDFAYIYSISYRTFVCRCDDRTLMRYDRDFVNLYCPRCGRKYTFGDIRKRISKALQEEEIGDIRRLGYNLREPVETVPRVAEFEPVIERATKKKKVKPVDQRIKRYKKFRKERGTGLYLNKKTGKITRR